MEVGPLLNDTEFTKNIALNQIHKGKKVNFLTNYTIELKKVSYSVNNKTILQHIDLKIPYRQSLIIMGEIGSGKSTLMKLLCGYFYPTQGQILYDTINIKDIDIEYLRKNITMMHQSITLFKRSVLNNLFYGMSIHKDDQLKKLTSLPIYKNIQSFILNNDATTLSGGQKQIVLLLRCYYRQPKILILDEPTANIDSNTKKIIISIIQLLKKSMTIICVSHDPEIFSLFDQQYLMKNGSLSLIV
jgi:ABC-type bacteriocin/lantibiotic exporter with double-glycine peptidase domain